MITVGNDYIVGVWDLSEFMCKSILKKEELKWQQAAFSATDKYIGLLGEDEEKKKSIIEIIDIQTGEILYKHSTNSIKTCIAWHPTLSIFVVAGENKIENRPESRPENRGEGYATFLCANTS
jgi:WD40 repeat protein